MERPMALAAYVAEDGLAGHQMGQGISGKEIRKVITFEMYINKISNKIWQKKIHTGWAFCLFNETIYSSVYDHASHLVGIEQVFVLQRN